MTNLIGLNIEDLTQAFQPLGLPAFRARQVFSWLYRHGATSFDVMSNIQKDTRALLAQHFTIARPTVASAHTSTDGTQKWLLRMTDGQEVETVHIPEVTRGTLCISSQVGCTLTCRFCHTGTQTLVRNLTAEELVGQVMVARDVFGEWPTPEGHRHISNIVLMGMGEPLYNFDNVKQAMKIVMDPEGLTISRRKITLSTSGVVPMMDRAATEIGVSLAVSLHAVTDDIRDVIVPLNKKYPIAELIAACRRYPDLSRTERVTFEYVMLKGVNDSPADARALVQLIRGIPSKVNLIPFNPWPGAPYERSSPKAIDTFAEIVYRAGYTTPIRRPRGQDILAACGQLRSESQRVRKSRVIASSI